MTHDYEFDFPVNLCRAPFARPGIYHFFSTNVLLCSIFLHIKARKLWQNKFRDKTAWITDLTTKRHKLQSNPINCTHCLFSLSIFSISPQLSYMESWNFSARQFFSTNDISDISDKYQVCLSQFLRCLKL